MTLMEKPEGQGPPGRPTHTWEDKIKKEHKEIG
jgi:hypothetical protein